MSESCAGSRPSNLKTEQGAPDERKATAEDGLAVLACFSCKRRKVKCNRVLPTCGLCTKIGAACEYPTHAEKPGPKAGTPQRNKRRRLGEEAPSPHSKADPDLQPRVEGGHASDMIGGVRRIPGYYERSGGPPSTGRVEIPVSSSIPTRQKPLGDQTVAQILYPAHEINRQPQSPSSSDPCPDGPLLTKSITIEDVCGGLKISRGCYDFLMESYFANMTTFRLFKPGSIEGKLKSMRTRAEAEALVASMFTFSARFDSGFDSAVRPDDCPPAHCFAQVASHQLERALDECGDMTPPLWVLHASILVTFYQLTRGVHSRAWRSLGSCVRIAYDMQIHIVDANFDREAGKDPRNIDIGYWSRQEERRRAWWAIWTMDAYASSIRRLPTAVDWNQNLTFLPVEDNDWYNNIYHESCFLVTDPSTRWKCLSATRNRSAEAWFIVILSLMRNIEDIVYPPGAVLTSRDRDDRRLDSCRADLDIMANCLCCTIMSLPQELKYNGEALNFRTKGSPRDINLRQHHHDKYSIHLIIQLCGLYTYHHKICASAPWLPETASEKVGLTEWLNYIHAADEIVNIIRNSAMSTERHSNPHLINIVWFAASAYVACKVFGPDTFDKRVAESNISTLKLCVERHVAFWDADDRLVKKLSKMEQCLRSLMARSASASVATEGQDKNLPTQQSVSTQSPGHKPGAASNALPPQCPTPATDQSFPNPQADQTMDLFIMPNPYDFTQPYFFPDSTGLMNNAPDFFPYGIEEMMMYGSTQQPS